MIRLYAIVLCTLCLAACRPRQSALHQADTPASTLRHAKGLAIEQHADYTVVEIADPWNAGALLQRYVLVDRHRTSLPDSLPEGTLIRIPLERVVVFTAVHCAALDELGAAGRIVGVCESRYMHTPAIRTQLAAGTTVDLGESTAPNVEKMVELGVEAVLASPFQNAGYGPIDKLGIPIIECADYMEASPLGRAEWLRLLGLLTGNETVADSLFAATETRYLALKARLATATPRPTLLTGKKYGSTWYMPCGESYAARLYADAGADYLFAYLPGAGSTPLTFETVFARAHAADYWIFNYNQPDALTLAGLRAEYEPYAGFAAFERRGIYGCNTHTVSFYEETPMHPDRLLEELGALFHPDSFPNYRPRYFVPLE